MFGSSFYSKQVQIPRGENGCIQLQEATHKTNSAQEDHQWNHLQHFSPFIATAWTELLNFEISANSLNVLILSQAFALSSSLNTF